VHRILLLEHQLAVKTSKYIPSYNDPREFRTQSGNDAEVDDIAPLDSSTFVQPLDVSMKRLPYINEEEKENSINYDIIQRIRSFSTKSPKT
ncbi:hypothetical protein HMI54_002019, partial [Coelomomyces lativittatus]